MAIDPSMHMLLASELEDAAAPMAALRDAAAAGSVDEATRSAAAGAINGVSGAARIVAVPPLVDLCVALAALLEAADDEPSRLPPAADALAVAADAFAKLTPSADAADAWLTANEAALAEARSRLEAALQAAVSEPVSPSPADADFSTDVEKSADDDSTAAPTTADDDAEAAEAAEAADIEEMVATGPTIVTSFSTDNIEGREHATAHESASRHRREKRRRKATDEEGPDVPPIDESMFDLFKAEADTALATLHEAILNIEHEPPTAESLETMMRAAHSMKGAARVINFQAAVALSHAMEDVFVAAQEGTIGLSGDYADSLLAAADALQAASAGDAKAAEAFSRESHDEIAGIVGVLEQLRDGAMPVSGGLDVNSLSAPANLNQPTPKSPTTNEWPPTNEPTPPASPPAVPTSAAGSLDAPLFLPVPDDDPDVAAWREAADDPDDSLYELFEAEAETQLAALHDSLTTIEDGSVDAAGLEGMMRAAHSLKGAARVIGLDAAVQIAHRMEDYFVAAQESRLSPLAEHTPVLFPAADTLDDLGKLAPSEVKAWVLEQAPMLVAQARGLEGLLRGETPAPASMPPSVSPGMTAPPSMADSGFGGGGSAAMDAFAGGADLGALPDDGQNLQDLEGAYGDAVASLVEGDGDASSAMSLLMGDYAPATPASKASGFKSRSAELNTGSQGFLKSGGFDSGSEAATLGGGGAMSSMASSGATATMLQTAEPTRLVRVTAESLTRLIAVASEALVEARRLPELAGPLLALKTLQTQLVIQIDNLQKLILERQMDNHQLANITDLHEQVIACQHMLSERLEEFDGMTRQRDDLATRLYDEAASSRMRPFSDGCHGFANMLKNNAEKLGKRVDFEIVGGSTDVDREVLDKLEAPLSHLLSNSLDHGVETLEEREAVGKPPVGTITLSAGHRAGMLVITVQDDGKGMDANRIREKIVRRGLTTEDVAANLSDAEVMDFIFLPGFSTKEDVTKLSGRGMGMDIVQTMAQQLGGGVRLESKLGVGTTLTMRLPVTISVIRALLVEVDEQIYALPLAQLDGYRQVPAESILEEDGKAYVMDGEDKILLASAREILELGDEPETPPELPIVIMPGLTGKLGLRVCELLSERDLVVRPLHPRLGKVPDVQAAALDDNGEPVLILDVEDVVRSVDNFLTSGKMRRFQKRDAAEGGPQQRVLIVEDSPTVRELERRLLEGQGYEVDIAVDGMDGWNALRQGEYDLVISDVDMPRMNGLEFIKLMRRNPDHKHLPVIIVSYRDSEEDRERGLDAGANVYMTKGSFNDKTILETVERLIGAGKVAEGDELAE